MIKIIKRGTKQTHKCSECGCVFSYEEEDVQIGIFNICDIIRCPQCNVSFVVNHYKNKQYM